MTRRTVVIVLVNIELDLATGVGVSQTQLCARNISILKTFQELLSVSSDTTKQIGSNVARVGGLGINARESGLDGTTEVLVLYSKGNWRLAGGLGQVQLEVRS